eukprot:CAMPEP_0206259616 /NCGR_PEP_ID=MMETSP0047_2-20121206/26588_1 /ASSEMBLY_ACC=CAM_ASM_000192 /TAXON_ID=195065 /ORGANISM="Chroomonas mesostigmatica_cf, Strain CCMP1168" /LENGTH=325 /DNA_ID=CAMNT_0053686519 /DNA_START=169 /DNA_END=1146 /DNA_ORIENTATION=+
MTFGWARSSSTVDSLLSGKMMDAFFDAGHKDVDTALVYSDGKTEAILGEICPPGSVRFGRMGCLATKAGPWEGLSMAGTGGLAPASVRTKIEASLKSLKRDSVDLYYLHAPDAQTNIEETLAVVDELHKGGKIKALGLSNFQAWEVSHIYHTCAAKGYIKPSVYQGMYNCVTRDVEKELLPCLRKLGIPFYAYNPLAGGILTGKHTKEDAPPPGRFKENKMYLDRFWKDAYFDAIKALNEECKSEGVTMTDASLRWLKNHSQLSGARGDGIIIGASSMEHLYDNLKCLASSTPLSEGLLKAFDDAWEECRRECPPYARGYSGSSL